MSVRTASGSDALTAREFLETVAGIRCPCGHHRMGHEPPRGSDLPGDFTEVIGACMEDGCDCKGVVE